MPICYGTWDISWNQHYECRKAWGRNIQPLWLCAQHSHKAHIKPNQSDPSVSLSPSCSLALSLSLPLCFFSLSCPLYLSLSVFWLCLSLNLFLSVSVSLLVSVSLPLCLYLSLSPLISSSSFSCDILLFHIIKPGCLLVPTWLPATVLTFREDWLNPLRFNWQAQGVGMCWPSLARPVRLPWLLLLEWEGPLPKKGLWVRQIPPELFTAVTKTINTPGGRECGM